MQVVAKMYSSIIQASMQLVLKLSMKVIKYHSTLNRVPKDRQLQM